MNSLLSNHGRYYLMPGFDLCTRRRVRLQKHWKQGSRDFLDAGSGNGWFSYRAYRSGASVTAVSVTEHEITKARKFYNGFLEAPEDRLQFQHLNFYQLDSINKKFDEIICYEALEHVKDDERVAKTFFDLLKPGGVLHLCCPNAEHPRWKNEGLDLEERGGHVRAGYTLESYKSLLEPLGFELIETEGVGGPILSKAEVALAKVRGRIGDLLATPLALMLFPTVWFDTTRTSCPFSIYVKALKPVKT